MHTQLTGVRLDFQQVRNNLNLHAERCKLNCASQHVVIPKHAIHKKRLMRCRQWGPHYGPLHRSRYNIMSLKINPHERSLHCFSTISSPAAPKWEGSDKHQRRWRTSKGRSRGEHQTRGGSTKCPCCDALAPDRSGAPIFFLGLSRWVKTRLLT